MNITKVPIIQIIKNEETIEVNPLTSTNNIGVSSSSLRLNTSIVNKELSFGELFSSQFSVQLFNIDDDLEGCDIQLFLEEDGVRTSKFKGVIDSSKRDNIGGYRDIIAYDWIYYHRNDDISNWWNNFWVNTRTSATIQEIRQSLVTYLGFTNDGKTYVNDSIVIPNNFNFYTDLKLNTIFKMICELQAVFPHIDENGNMEFISITNTNTSDLTGLYEGNNSKWEDYTTELITGVGIYSTGNDLSQLIGTTDNVYNISGNLFALALDAQTLNALGNNILNAISNIQFTPSKIKMIVSDFDLKLGQRINTSKGYGYVMTNSLSGVCLIEQTIESKSMGSKLSQRVDSRNDTLIEGARMSKFEQDIDGFNLEVQRIDNVAASANQNAQTALNNSNRAIVTDTLHYLATPLSSGVTTATADWTTTTQSITETNKYLWTYHTYTYADSHTADTAPVISGVYGDKGEQGQVGQQGEQGEDGVGITEVTPLYYVSDSSTIPSAPSSEVTTTTTTSYNTWTKGIPAMTTTYRYMFTCEQIKYTDNTFVWTTPVLDNALSTAFSEIKQTADQIVLKVDVNGNVTQVALSGDASTGTKVVIKGDNIQLDGDVTITSGFKLTASNINVSTLSSITANLGTVTAGTIQSSNYVANTSGMRILLSNGTLDSKNFKISNTGDVTATNLYATDIVFINSLLYHWNNNNYYFAKIDTDGDFCLYDDGGDKIMQLSSHNSIYACSHILFEEWGIEDNFHINGHLYVKGTFSGLDQKTGVDLSCDSEGGQIILYGTSINWLIDCYDNASLRFYQNNGKYIRFANDGTIWFKQNTRLAVGTYTNSTFTSVGDILKITSSNYGLLSLTTGSNFSFAIASWSDSTLKKNIKDSKVNALNIINKIRMREFDFIDSEYGTHEDIGYVANELKEIIPEAVVAVPISEEEQKKYGKDTLYQVNDTAAIKYLVKAIQELSNKVILLENKLKTEE